MDPISRLSRTLAVLRETGKPRADTAQAKSSGSGAARKLTKPEIAAQGLRAEIVGRMHMIAPDDPSRRQASIRIFVERVLVHELGSQLQRSPRFQGIVADVQQAMESDEGVRAELEGLISELDPR